VVIKDGFYIYYKVRSKEMPSTQPSRERIPITVLPVEERGLRRIEPSVEVAVEVAEQEVRRGGKYRQMMQEQKAPRKDNGNIGIAVAVAMLVFVVGVAVYENSDSILGKRPSIETNLFWQQNSTEVSGEDIQESDTEASANQIEVEVIPGN